MRGCWCLGFKLADTEKRRNSIDILSPSGYDKRMPASDESKRDMLKRAGAWNAAWARVQAAVFAEHPDFCDAENLVQVKYEMLRAHHVDGLPVAEVARMFGFSRQTVYLTDAAFAIEGFGGLLTKKRGPKHPRKLTAEMVDFLTRRREQVPAISATALAEDLQQRFQATIHPRSIQRLLKKKPLGHAPASHDRPAGRVLAAWWRPAGRVRAGAQHRTDSAPACAGHPVRAHHHPTARPSRRERWAMERPGHWRCSAGLVWVARPTPRHPAGKHPLAAGTHTIDRRR